MIDNNVIQIYTYATLLRLLKVVFAILLQKKHTHLSFPILHFIPHPKSASPPSLTKPTPASIL